MKVLAWVRNITLQGTPEGTYRMSKSDGKFRIELFTTDHQRWLGFILG